MDSIRPQPPPPLSLADLAAQPVALTVPEAVALALGATEEHDDPWATTLHAIPALGGVMLRHDGVIVLGEPSTPVEAAIAGRQLADLVRTLLQRRPGGAGGVEVAGVDGDGPDTGADEAAAAPADLEALLQRASPAAQNATFDYPAFRLDLTRFGNPTPALLSAIHRRSTREPDLETPAGGDAVGPAGGGRTARILAVAVASWLAGIVVGAGAALLLDRAGILQGLLQR